MKRKHARIVSYALALTLIAIIITGCLQDTAQSYNYDLITSFRDIPGITQAEIAAIEALQARETSFIYASSRSTELFERRDGTLSG